MSGETAATATPQPIQAGSASFGSLWQPQPYDPTTDWATWEDQFDIYALAKNLTTDNDKKIALLHAIGTKAYTDLKAWTKPKKPVDLKYAALLKILQERYGEKIDPMIARLELSSTKQKHDEAPLDYVRRMTALATNCEFKDERSLILDIVKGVRSEKLREYLLRSENLKTSTKELQDVIRSHAAYEKVAKAARTVDTTAPFTINQIRASNECYRCGKTYIPGHKCPARQVTCNFCKKLGHYEKMCYQKKKQSSQEEDRDDIQNSKEKRKSTTINEVADDTSGSGRMPRYPSTYELTADNDYCILALDTAERHESRGGSSDEGTLNTTEKEEKDYLNNMKPAHTPSTTTEKLHEELRKIKRERGHTLRKALNEETRHGKTPKYLALAEQARILSHRWKSHFKHLQLATDPDS